MQAQISLELWLRRRVARCGKCGCWVPATGASYSCKDCRYSLCLGCAAFAPTAPPCGGFLEAEIDGGADAAPGGKLLSPSDIMEGDILLCGPDWWGIHHIVLCRGRMRPAAAHMVKQMRAHESNLESMELFECETIESSRPLKGAKYPWYPATTYFGRRAAADAKHGGELVVVADIADGTNVIGINNEVVPVKLLLHPCRPGRGGPPLNVEQFRSAVDMCAKDSRRWSKLTALTAITARHTRLNAKDYGDVPARARLMDDLRRRWGKRPICSSVAIQIWQRYFELVHGSDPRGADAAAKQILRWMPVRCDKTAPSALLQVLSTSGWILCENLPA